MCPPKPGEPSYQQFIAVSFFIFNSSLQNQLKFDEICCNYMQEKNDVLQSLKVKADLITKLFNSIEGIKCNPVEGAMYAFPQITIPKRAIEKAKVSGT